TFELAQAELDRVVGPGLAARILEPLRIAPFIAKLQRIERNLGDSDVDPGLVVEDGFQARLRAHAHVVVGPGNDELVRRDVLVEHELPGLRTFDPEILRRLATREVVANLRTDDV